MIAPGAEIHYVSLLDSLGDTLHTVAIDAPIRVPDESPGVKITSVDVRINVTVELLGRGGE